MFMDINLCRGSNQQNLLRGARHWWASNGIQTTQTDTSPHVFWIMSMGLWVSASLSTYIQHLFETLLMWLWLMMIPTPYNWWCQYKAIPGNSYSMTYMQVALADGQSKIVETAYYIFEVKSFKFWTQYPRSVVPKGNVYLHSDMCWCALCRC